MKTNFTKGEWIITAPKSKSETQRIATTAIQENPNKVPYICDMWGMATEEGKANAKLISSAPDMFNSIVKLQEWSKKYPAGRIYSYGEAATIEKELTEIVEEQLKAIQKAVGSDFIS